jgi:Fe-S-cluster-containing dehydrogenase component
MEVCPSGALTRDTKTHAVVVDKSRCVGCGLCVTACPFGSIQVDGLHQVAFKCDLCGGSPLCVQVCMAGALHFGSLRELGRLRRRQGDRNLAIRAVPWDGGCGDEV